MSLVSAAGPLAVQTSITNMPEGGLIVMSIVVMFLLAALLLPPVLAGRAPRNKGPASTPPWSGPVQGGVHAGDGRSVAPHRDAPAEGYDQDDVARGRAGVQATVIRDGEEVSGTGRAPAGEEQADGEEQPGRE
jgi:hypothetical protein